MPLPQCYNFAGIPLATKFGWFEGSPGARAVTPVADNLKGFGSAMNQAVQDCDAAMTSIGADWKGRAATAARRSLAGTAGRASETEQVTGNGADRLLDYGSSYEHTRTQIAFVDPKQFSPVEKAGDNISEAWQSLWGDGADHVTIGEMNQANNDAADRALRAHAVQTGMADDRFVTATATAPAPPSGSLPPAPDGAAAGEPVPPPPVAPAGGGDPGGRPVTSPPPSASPAPATSTSGGGVAPAPVPTTGVGGGGVGGPANTGQERTGGDPNRSVAGLPTATAQAPSRGAPGGSGPDRPVIGAPSDRGGSGASGTTTGSGGGAWRPGAPSANDQAARRAELGRNFGRDLASGRLAPPGGPDYGGFGGSHRPGTGWGGPPTSGGGPTGRPGWGGAPTSGNAGTRAPGWGAEPGGGRSATGGWGGESGGRAPAAEQRGWVRGGAEGHGGRPVPAEPAAGGRSGTGAGYAPMMAGAGAGGQTGQEHRNRYLIPTDEAFDVDLTFTPPVLGPLADDGRD